MLQQVATIAITDVRRRLRDRSLLIQAIVGPVVLAIIVSLAFGSSANFRPDFAIVDADNSELTRGFVAALLDTPELDTELLADRASAVNVVDDGERSAALVLPTGFGQEVQRGGSPVIEVITNPERRISGAVAESIADSFAADIRLRSLAVGALVISGADVDTATAAAVAVASPLVIRDSGTEQIDPASYFAPSMGILFLFFTMGIAARGMLQERAMGTLARIQAAPVRREALLVGKTVATVIIGVFSLGIVWVVTVLAVGADWGPPGAVFAIIVAVVLAVAALGAVVTALSRTEAQADGYTSVVAFAMALLGGNFVAPGATPDILRRLSLFTPNGWALRSITELSAGADASTAVVPVLVLIGYAAAVGGVAVVLMRRLVPA